MGIRTANIWKHSLFKNIRYIFGSPVRMHARVNIGEEGIISLSRLPLATGYMVSETDKASWASIPRLKKDLAGFDEPVLLTSERSYVPLDPTNKMGDDRERLIPLDQIATTRYNRAFNQVPTANKQSVNAKMFQTVLWIGGIIAIIIIFALLLKK